VQRLPVIGQSFAHSAVETVQRAAFEASGPSITIERWERTSQDPPLEAMRSALATELGLPEQGIAVVGD